MVVIYTPYITVKGRRLWAYDYGLKAWRIVVTQEQHEAYLARKGKKSIG